MNSARLTATRRLSGASASGASWALLPAALLEGEPQRHELSLLLLGHWPMLLWSSAGAESPGAIGLNRSTGER